MNHEKGLQFEALANEINKSGGVSFDTKRSGTVKSGYMVGDGKSETQTGPLPVSAGDVAAHAAKRPNARYIGGWEHEGQGYLDFPTRHPVTAKGESTARIRTIKNNEMAYGRVEGHEYQGDVMNPYHDVSRKADVVASDTPAERQAWAEIPGRTGVHSTGPTKAWADPAEQKANLDKMMKNQGQSFS